MDEMIMWRGWSDGWNDPTDEMMPQMLQMEQLIKSFTFCEISRPLVRGYNNMPYMSKPFFTRSQSDNAQMIHLGVNLTYPPES